MDRNRWYGRRQSVHIPYKRFFAVNRRIKRETLKTSTFFFKINHTAINLFHRSRWSFSLYGKIKIFIRVLLVLDERAKILFDVTKRGQKASENIEGCSCVDGSKQSVLHVRDNRPWSFYFLSPCTRNPPVYISYLFPLDLALHSVVPCHF